MDRRYYFERNLLALSARNPPLCSRLSAAETTLNRYRFLESRSGDVIPALVDSSGAAHPLHSTVDPRREGERLVSARKASGGTDEGLKTDGFLVFLGLGGAYAPEAALLHIPVSHILIIDYDINGTAELFCSKEYIKILSDPRCTLLIDPSPESIEACILAEYRPALAGGIKTIPLRTRTELDIPRFSAAACAIQRAIEAVAADYSVQAWFGTRWFSNIIRNLKTAEARNEAAPPIRDAAICAAGPSLDQQIPLLAEYRERHKGASIIAADTALPALLQSGITPDAVVSIDCQHISCYHFLGINALGIPLFLDIASPPLVSRFSAAPFFFSGGHPLALYLSQHWRPLPLIDTSGGNVTYACLSLAENLGAERIHVYGADFSYPKGMVYARGTYIYRYFENRQGRLSPLEAQRSALLYRSPFVPPEEPPSEYHETAALRFYRKRFEQKAASMEAQIIPAPGIGCPLQVPRKAPHTGGRRIIRLFAPGRAAMTANDFLAAYRNALVNLPPAGADSGAYSTRLNAEQRQIFTTLLPQAAAVKRRQPGLAAGELIETVKRYCVDEIERVLG
jgi:hypothetical protein